MKMIPSEQECLKLLKEHNPKLMRHSVCLKELALKVADLVERRGSKVDRELLIAGALLHDIRKTFGNDDHNIKGKEFVESLGYHEVGGIIENHFFGTNPETTEEKIIFYVDKLLNPGRKVVSLNERMQYLIQRYGFPEEKVKPWLEEVMAIERELLGVNNGKRLL